MSLSDQSSFSDIAAGVRQSIDSASPETIEFVVHDYLRHLDHHLNQILP